MRECYGANVKRIRPEQDVSCRASPIKISCDIQGSEIESNCKQVKNFLPLQVEGEAVLIQALTSLCG